MVDRKSARSSHSLLELEIVAQEWWGLETQKMSGIQMNQIRKQSKFCAILTKKDSDR